MFHFGLRTREAWLINAGVGIGYQGEDWIRIIQYAIIATAYRDKHIRRPNVVFLHARAMKTHPATAATIRKGKQKAEYMMGPDSICRPLTTARKMKPERNTKGSERMVAMTK